MTDSANSVCVLHVDDDADFADLSATWLEREDERISVETATSVKEGLERLDSIDFDCIISDYDMPELSGIEFLRTVREYDCDLPFILFTGKGSEEVASDAISAGVTDYVQKEAGTDQYTILANRILNSVNQYRAERTAEQTEQRLFELAENTSDALWMFSGDWSELLYINSAYEDIWGQPVESLEKRPTAFLDGIHPEDRDRVKRAMDRLSNGQEVDIEYRVNADENFTRWVWVQAEPIIDEDGNVIRIAGFARDVTEHKESAKELKRERDRVQAIAEAFPDVVIVYDREGRYLEVLTGQDNLLVDDPKVLEGKTIDEVLAPDVAKKLSQAINKTLDTGSIQTVEYRLDLDGKITFFEGRLAPLAAHPSDQVILLARDITQRKKFERELQRHNERLEKFASVVSHDLQNPLNVAFGNLELASEECESEFLDNTYQSLERMETLIQDLLLLARNGRTVSEYEPVDFDMAVRQAWRNVETNGATLAADSDQAIHADPSRLKQLFENLFRNAIEHGGERVTVRVMENQDGFYVEDDGPGIPKAERNQIFEPGYSNKTNGTGFGLSIVKEIADAHDWEIEVSNGKIGGSRFKFRNVEFTYH